MSTEGFSPYPIEVLGSMVTNMDPGDIPLGLSPDCQDIEFVPGGVRTRPGTRAAFTAIAGVAPSVNGIRSFITLGGTQRILTYTSDGQLSKGVYGALALTLIQSGMPSGTYIKADTANGESYLAISDGKLGKHAGTKYDDTRLDRVSQEGPGSGPLVADEAATGPFTIDTVPNSGAVRAVVTANIETAVNSGVVRAANVTTVKTTAAHGLSAGWQVVIAGVTDVSFNGTFTIVAVPSATTFTYAHIAADGSSGAGTATSTMVTIKTLLAHGLAVGNRAAIAGVTDPTFQGSFVVEAVPSATTFQYTQLLGAAVSGDGTVNFQAVGTVAAGVHKVVVWFELTSGYYTKYSPPVTWTAFGGKRVTLTGIPTGPANVLRRRIGFTGTGGARFYHMKDRMVIDDNVTTTLTLDFTDNGLLSGQNVDALLRRVVLPYGSGVISYATRLFWYGLEKAMPGFNNMSFDGGFSGATPLGWTFGGGAGGSKEAADIPFGEAYRITGDGATAVRGLITQNALVDAWAGLTLLDRRKAYTIRARVKRSAGLVAGRLNIDCFGSAFDTAGLQLTAAQTTTAWTQYEAELMPAQTTLPVDLVVRVFADQTPTNGEYFLVDELRILPSDKLNDGSTVFASAGDDPDNYDGSTGLMVVSRNNGQELRGAFKLREFLYFLKERSLHVTQDDGINNPADWTITEVDPVVGTPSVNGWALGEGFAVIANKTGAYYFNGGIPSKVSQEYQDTWDRINWDGAGHTVWVTIDPKRRRVLFGVPMDGALSPNKILALDYVGNSTSDAPSGALLVSPLSDPEGGRKWTIWNLALHCGELVETSSGQQTLFGNSTGSGKIFVLDSTVKNDDGAAIDGYYRPHFIDSGSSGLDDFGYLTAHVRGSGTLSVSAYIPDDYLGAQPVGTQILYDPAGVDLEMGINLVTERASLKFGTNAVGEWFQISKVVVYRSDYAFGIARGR